MGKQMVRLQWFLAQAVNQTRRFWCWDWAETRQQEQRDADAGKKRLPFWSLQAKLDPTANQIAGREMDWWVFNNLEPSYI